MSVIGEFEVLFCGWERIEGNDVTKVVGVYRYVFILGGRWNILGQAVPFRISYIGR